MAKDFYVGGAASSARLEAVRVSDLSSVEGCAVPLSTGAVRLPPRKI